MNQEQLLLEYWRELAPEAQAQVIQVARSLSHPQHQHNIPEHLQIRSTEQLDQLLLQGVESLERGEGIELTDEWWEQEHQRLRSRSRSAK